VRRTSAEGAFSPRARRTSPEGAFSPRAGRTPPEGAFIPRARWTPPGGGGVRCSSEADLARGGGRSAVLLWRAAGATRAVNV
jgi:hypothetical protein